MNTEHIIPRVRESIAGLTEEVGGVRGVLVATSDGHPLTHTLPRTDAGEDSSLSTAAMIAALLGIGQRLAALTGDHRLLEATVRSPTGSVVSYAVGSRAVMTVLTDATVNLARLNVAARLRVSELCDMTDQLDAIDDAGPGALADHPLPPPPAPVAGGIR